MLESSFPLLYNFQINLTCLNSFLSGFSLLLLLNVIKACLSLAHLPLNRFVRKIWRCRHHVILMHDIWCFSALLIFSWKHHSVDVETRGSEEIPLSPRPFKHHLPQTYAFSGFVSSYREVTNMLLKELAIVCKTVVCSLFFWHHLVSNL